MAELYFIGDNHFYHEAIIRYENRPFENVEEMNEHMIDAWNREVGKKSKVMVLGDFMFHPKQHLQEIVPRLRGDKILIMGNHDRVSVKNYYEAGFKEVYRYPVIYDDFVILSHRPMYVNSSMPYANIYAHVHGSSQYRDYTENTMCVSVERKHINYTPISYEKVKMLMKKEAEAQR